MPLGFGRSIIGTTTAAPVPARDAVTVTANGNAQLDTAQTKFGSASGLFDGTGDYLTFDSNMMGTGNFTFEMFFRPAAIGTLTPIWWCKSSSGANDGGLYMNSTGGLTWWNPNSDSGESANVNSSDGFGNISANNWYHIACMWDGTDRYMSVNGTVSSRDDTNWLGGTASDVLEIGRASYTGTVFTATDLDGHLDEIRMSDVVRTGYTSNFTAPTSAFSNDADTTMLLHCDGTDGSTTFTDDTTT